MQRFSLPDGVQSKAILTEVAMMNYDLRIDAEMAICFNYPWFTCRLDLDVLAYCRPLPSAQEERRVPRRNALGFPIYARRKHSQKSSDILYIGSSRKIFP